MQRGRSDEAARLRRMPHRGPNVHGLVDRRDLPRMRRHSERVLGGRFRKCLRPYGVIAVDDSVVLPRRRMRGRGQRLVLVQAMTRRSNAPGVFKEFNYDWWARAASFIIASCR